MMKRDRKHDGKDLIVPQLSFSDDCNAKVRKIACGGNHTVLLLEDGTSYGCGDNSRNQLTGVSEINHWQKWQHLDIAGNVRDVTCGWEFTVVINQENGVLSRGLGPKGELGLGSTKQTDTFTKIMTVNEGSKIFASFQNCTLIEPIATGTRRGSRVYGWGSNTKCQLLEPRSRIIDRPTVIYESYDTELEYAAMGKDFIVLVDKEGRIVRTSGSMPVGFIPEHWTSQRGLQIHCMWTSLHVWAPDRGVYSYGNGKHGQLYNREKWWPANEIKKMAVGSEHGILLGEGTVACWGWGEHGNCGRLRKDIVDPINDYSNVVSPLHDLLTTEDALHTNIYGGCATTWIVVEC